MKIILTYVDDAKIADRIIENLLKERLAACVGILEGKSNYWWKGEIVKNAKEFHLIIKTTEKLADEAVKRIGELHSYELPAIDVIDVEKVSSGIEAWLADVTK